MNSSTEERLEKMVDEYHGTLKFMDQTLSPHRGLGFDFLPSIGQIVIKALVKATGKKNYKFDNRVVSFVNRGRMIERWVRGHPKWVQQVNALQDWKVLAAYCHILKNMCDSLKEYTGGGLTPDNPFVVEAVNRGWLKECRAIQLAKALRKASENVRQKRIKMLDITAEWLECVLYEIRGRDQLPTFRSLKYRKKKTFEKMVDLAATVRKGFTGKGFSRQTTQEPLHQHWPRILEPVAPPRKRTPSDPRRIPSPSKAHPVHNFPLPGGPMPTPIRLPSSSQSSPVPSTSSTSSTSIPQRPERAKYTRPKPKAPSPPGTTLPLPRPPSPRAVGPRPSLPLPRPPSPRAVGPRPSFPLPRPPSPRAVGPRPSFPLPRPPSPRAVGPRPSFPLPRPPSPRAVGPRPSFPLPRPPSPRAVGPRPSLPLPRPPGPRAVGPRPPLLAPEGPFNPPEYDEELPLNWAEDDGISMMAFDRDIVNWFVDNRQQILNYPEGEFLFLPTYDEFFRSICDWNFTTHKMVVAPYDNLTGFWEAEMCDEVQNMIRQHKKAYIRQLYLMMDNMRWDVICIRQNHETFSRFQHLVLMGSFLRRDPLYVAVMLIAEFNMLGSIARAWQRN